MLRCVSKTKFSCDRRPGQNYVTPYFGIICHFQSNSRRLWNPYVLSKPAGTLSGHNAGITSLIINHEDSQLISLSEDKAGSWYQVVFADNLSAVSQLVAQMWNFNNGMILRKMMKQNILETTDVVYVEMGSNHYIIAVGWDKQIAIFVDDPDHFETHPVRVLNGSGWGAHKGHEDDISSVAFCAPNILATASADGVIVVWNLESGYIKLTLREPFLELRSKEEKVVEKVSSFCIPTIWAKSLDFEILFLQNPEKMGSRFWDIYDGIMVYEMNCQITEDEGLGTMALNPDSTMLMLGGSRGHLRVSYNENILESTYTEHIKVLKLSATFQFNPIQLECGHLMEVPWVIDDPRTYMPLPADVKKESALEKQQNQLITTHREIVKKDVLETWKHGIEKDFNENVDVKGLSIL
ncbi:hypothetical protein HDU83_009315 [Entophlyctis luteolus]|nr:hypothetical protein HDU83_009315 [Entophlyctis luteolus]